MAPSTERRIFKVVIIGGGVVGSFAAAALSKLPETQVSLYEKDPGVKDRVPALTLSGAAIETLERIINVKRFKSRLWRYPTGGGMSSRHWKTGECLVKAPSIPQPVKFEDSDDDDDDDDGDGDNSTVQHIDIHNCILKHIPKGTINYGYEALSVELDENEPVKEPATITLKNHNDGCKITKVEADLVIAADGVSSKIRHQFLKDEAEYTGIIVYRSVFDEDVVGGIEGLSHELTLWRGPNASVFMTKLLPDKFKVSIHVHESTEFAETVKWNSTSETGWEKKRLIQHFRNWDPLICRVLEKIPNFRTFPLKQTKWITDLVMENKVVIIGDASHPTSGSYGAGCRSGFDDVYALYRSLKASGIVKENGDCMDCVKSNDTDENDEYDLEKSFEKAFYLFTKTRAGFLKDVINQIKLDKKINSDYVSGKIDDKEWMTRIKKASLQARSISRYNVHTAFNEVCIEKSMADLGLIH